MIGRISIKNRYTFHKRIAKLEFKLCANIPEHSINVQGHKVKYSNCNNSAADCPIDLKFGTEFDHGTSGTLQMFKVKGQGHSVT